MSKDEPIAIAFDPADVEKLRQINTRLFAPAALTPDERRDLANLMHLLLNRGEPINE